MYTVLLAVSAGLVTGLLLAFFSDFGYGWSTFFGVLALGAGQIGMGFFFQRKVKAIMLHVQSILVDGQKRLQAKTARWQMRPPASLKEAQNEIARDQKVFALEALAVVEELRRYVRWVPFMARQIATAQFQLRWMIRDFKAVDALMPKALFFEPVMSAMKLARMYATDAARADMEKVYTKAVARLRYNQNELLAATWSWILLKRGETDDAFKALNAALKKSDSPVLKANRDHLANNRPSHFSNAGLGENWYQLFLEEPKVRAPRQRMSWR